jgi:acetyl/propionyl-CoA carboxylase alpha subunit
MKISCGGLRRDVRVEKDLVRLDDRPLDLRFSWGPKGGLEVWLGGERHRAAFVRDGDRLLVWLAGRTFTFERTAARSARAAEHAGSLAAPMPGRVRRTLVKEGERVEKGQVVLVLEAMKMEHAIRAPGAGVVARFFHGEGDLVDAGTELAVIE